MVEKCVVNERNRDFPSFFKGQICTFANETEVFHKGYFGQSVLDFIFPWFCPVFVPSWFCITRQEFTSGWFATVKTVFWRIGNGNLQQHPQCTLLCLSASILWCLAVSSQATDIAYTDTVTVVVWYLQGACPARQELNHHCCRSLTMQSYRIAKGHCPFPALSVR